jgi:hypothetical protein
MRRTHFVTTGGPDAPPVAADEALASQAARAA